MLIDKKKKIQKEFIQSNSKLHEEFINSNKKIIPDEFINEKNKKDIEKQQLNS